MRRKLAMILTGALMTMALAGCGSKNSSPSSSTSGEVSANDNQTLELIVAHNQTSLENPYAFGMNKFKETVEELSDGQIKVTVHHGTLGENESELIEKLEMGAASMVVASPGFMTSIGVKELDMFSLLYLFDSFDHWEKSVDGEFGDSMKEVVTDKTDNAFRIMGYWTSSVRDYYGKKSIKTPDDIKGMTLRTQTSGVVQEYWKTVGAIPTNVAWGELYQALSQGVVDSAENDYTNFMLKEHHKTANGKFISETHHDYTTRLLLMNGNFYDSLTDEQKGWIDEACKAATEEERQVTYKMFEESKEKVIADGAIVVPFEDMDIEAFKAIAIPIQDKFAQENNMVEELDMIRAAK